MQKKIIIMSVILFPLSIHPVLACSFAGPISFSGHVDFYDPDTLLKVYEQEFSKVSIGASCELTNFNLKLNESYYVLATSEEELTIFDLRWTLPIETTVEAKNLPEGINDIFHNSNPLLDPDNSSLFTAQRILFSGSEFILENHNILLKNIVGVENSSRVDLEFNKNNDSDIIIYQLRTKSTSDYFVAFSVFSDVSFTKEVYSLYYYDFETKNSTVMTFLQKITEPFDPYLDFVVSADREYLSIFSFFVNEYSDDPIGLIYNLEENKVNFLPKNKFEEFRVLNINEADKEIAIYYSTVERLEEGPKPSYYIATLNLENFSEVMTNKSFSRIDDTFISSKNFLINAYYLTHKQINFPLDILLVTIISLPFLRVIKKCFKKKDM